MTADIKPGLVLTEDLKTGIQEVSSELFGYQHVAPDCEVVKVEGTGPERTYRLRCKTHNVISGLALTDYIPK